MSSRKVQFFLAELRRRKVVRVAIVYVVGAWVLLQVGDTILDLGNFPTWTGQILLAVAALGLPVALVLAWIFDITPEGIVSTDSDGEPRLKTPRFVKPDAIDIAELDLIRPQLRSLIGRNDECMVIAERIEDARCGHGGILVIGGEPGVGKTRLGEEALELGCNLGLLPLVGHAYEEHDAPFIVASEILEEITRALPASTLRNIMADTAPEIARVLPELRRQFDDIPAAIELRPEQQQRYLFNALLEFLERLSQAVPIIMLLDDLHWADESSTLLLEHLAPQLPKLPVLMVVTFRDVPAEMGGPFRRVLASLSRQPYVSRISLKNLSQNEVAEFLGSLGGPNPPLDIVKLIYQQTEGNVFFVQSVYQHLADEGRLFDAAGQWLSDIDPETLAVPEGVRLIIQHRIERLHERTRRTMALAAILGLRFDPKVIYGSSDYSPDEVLNAIELSEAAQLIVPTMGQRESRYEFTHALVRRTLLEDMSPLRRERLHLRVAETMQDMYGETDPQVAVIASHLYRAGTSADTETTIRYLRLAADRAFESAAIEEALRDYEQALSLVPEQQKIARADLLLKCGSLRRSEHWAESETDLKTALELYVELQEYEAATHIMCTLSYMFSFQGREVEAMKLIEDGLALIGRADSPARCYLSSALGVTHAIAGRQEEAARSHAEALQMAQKLQDRDLLAAVLRNRALGWWQEFDGRNLLADGGAAVELNRAGYEAWELASNLSWQQTGLALTGQFEPARQVGLEIAEIVAANGDTVPEMISEIVNTMLHLAGGDLNRAIRSAKHAADINAESGFPWGGHFYGYLSYVQMLAGRWDEAKENLNLALANTVSGTCWDHGDRSYGLTVGSYIDPSLAERIWEDLEGIIPDHVDPLPSGTLQVLMTAAESLFNLGRIEEAGNFHGRICDFIKTGKLIHQFQTGLIEKSAAIAATAAQKFNAAEKHFQSALDQADNLPYATEQGEVRRWYARMLISRDQPGDSEHARNLLRDAIAVYERVGMPKHLKMAAALLKEAGHET